MAVQCPSCQAVIENPAGSGFVTGPVCGSCIAEMRTGYTALAGERYRRTLDGVVIHAVGSDGADNQGNLWRGGNVGPNQDVGFQLWDRR